MLHRNFILSINSPRLQSSLDPASPCLWLPSRTRRALPLSPAYPVCTSRRYCKATIWHEISDQYTAAIVATPTALITSLVAHRCAVGRWVAIFRVIRIAVISSFGPPLFSSSWRPYFHEMECRALHRLSGNCIRCRSAMQRLQAVRHLTFESLLKRC